MVSISVPGAILGLNAGSWLTVAVLTMWCQMLVVDMAGNFVVTWRPYAYLGLMVAHNEWAWSLSPAHCMGLIDGSSSCPSLFSPILPNVNEPRKQCYLSLNPPSHEA